MATERYYDCAKCGTVPVRMSMLDSLLEFARLGAAVCPACAQPADLRLNFAFGLDAGDSDCTVSACFVPRHPEQWKNRNGHNVTFFPFLVVVQRHRRETATWLPYWHVVENGEHRMAKYGQWAPLMDERLFVDLMAQARERGYLRPAQLTGREDK